MSVLNLKPHVKSHVKDLKEKQYIESGDKEAGKMSKSGLKCFTKKRKNKKGRRKSKKKSYKKTKAQHVKKGRKIVLKKDASLLPKTHRAGPVFPELHNIPKLDVPEAKAKRRVGLIPVNTQDKIVTGPQSEFGFGITPGLQKFFGKVAQLEARFKK